MEKELTRSRPMQSRASEGQKVNETSPNRQSLPSNPSNPPNSLENDRIFYKSSGVTGGCWGGKVTREKLDRARAYVAAIPGAISGSRGHDQTFALANALTWGFALDEQTVFALMSEWNTTCQPPWKERELRHKIRDALKANHQKPFGYLLTAGEHPRHFRAPLVAPPPQTAVWKIESRPAAAKAELLQIRPPLPSQAGREPDLAVEWPPLVMVPSCKTGRPPEIVMADIEWQKLDESASQVNRWCNLLCNCSGRIAGCLEKGGQLRGTRRRSRR